MQPNPARISGIIQYRRKAGLTQAAIVQKSGLPRRTVQRIEKEGNIPHLDNLICYLQACGVGREMAIEIAEKFRIGKAEGERRGRKRRMGVVVTVPSATGERPDPLADPTLYVGHVLHQQFQKERGRIEFSFPPRSDEFIVSQADGLGEWSEVDGGQSPQQIQSALLDILGIPADVRRIVFAPTSRGVFTVGVKLENADSEVTFALSKDGTGILSVRIQHSRHDVVTDGLADASKKSIERSVSRNQGLLLVPTLHPNFVHVFGDCVVRLRNAQADSEFAFCAHAPDLSRFCPNSYWLNNAARVIEAGAALFECGDSTLNAEELHRLLTNGRSLRAKIRTLHSLVSKSAGALPRVEGVALKNKFRTAVNYFEQDWSPAHDRTKLIIASCVERMMPKTNDNPACGIHFSSMSSPNLGLPKKWGDGDVFLVGKKDWVAPTVAQALSKKYGQILIGEIHGTDLALIAKDAAVSGRMVVAGIPAKTVGAAIMGFQDLLGPRTSFRWNSLGTSAAIIESFA